MKEKKRKTVIFNGLGFPIKLLNAPMKKIFGEWCVDINLNKLMLAVFEGLAHKPTSLTPDELRFIRSYLKMTLAEFGKTFGISHVAVLKWEKGKNKISPSLEICIRLYILNYLEVKDTAFRALYKEVSLEQLAKGPKRKIHPLAFNLATEEFKIAL